MANINIGAPSAFYTVEKILEISGSQDSHKSYKVQWAPSWISEIYLRGCDTLIEQFLIESSRAVSQSTSEEVKQEYDSHANLKEIESASHDIDILTAEKNTRNTQLEAQCDQNKHDDQEGVTITEKSVLSETIKIEEDDSSTCMDGSKSSNQVYPDTDRSDIGNVNAIREQSQGSSANIHDENYNFDRCIANFPNSTCLPITSLEIPSWTSTTQNSVVQDINMDDSSYLKYPGNKQKASCTIQYKPFKHTTAIDVTGKSLRKDQVMNRNYPNITSEGDLLIQPINTFQTNVKSNVKQGQDNILTILKHPSKNLPYISSTNCLLKQNKHTLIDTDNDASSSYTKFSKTFFMESDKNSTIGDNTTIDTTGYKSASTYVSYSDSSLEHYDTGQNPNRISSNERDINRHSDIADEVNMPNSFEKSVVNQYEDSAGDTESLPSSTTASINEIQITPTDDSTTTVHFDTRHGTLHTVSMDKRLKRDLKLKNTELFDEPSSVLEVYQMHAGKSCTRLQNFENSAPCDMETVLDENHVETAYTCQICSLTFTTKKQYLKHLKLHGGKHVYRCNLCLKEFRVKDTLQRHFRVHTGERPYTCEICGLKFKDQSNLKIHIRRKHTFERPYKCTWCIKRCATSSDLKKHIRIHTGECPYECTFCKRRYKTSSELISHKRKCTSRM